MMAKNRLSMTQGYQVITTTTCVLTEANATCIFVCFKIQELNYVDDLCGSFVLIKTIEICLKTL